MRYKITGRNEKEVKKRVEEAITKRGDKIVKYYEIKDSFSNYEYRNKIGKSKSHFIERVDGSRYIAVMEKREKVD